VREEACEKKQSSRSGVSIPIRRTRSVRPLASRALIVSPSTTLVTTARRTWGRLKAGGEQ
jgi:hypothetical protein